MRNLRVAFGQTNPVVGDFKHNLAQIQNCIEQASGEADLLVFGELALCGYPLGDLSYRRDIIDASELALEKLTQITKDHADLTIVVGHASHASGKLAQSQESFAIAHNSASAIRAGEVLTTYHKQLLPNLDVFEDSRKLVPGHNESFI